PPIVRKFTIRIGSDMIPPLSCTIVITYIALKMIPIIGAKKNKILSSFVTIFLTSFFVIPILYNFLYFILSCSISVNKFKYNRINVAKKNKILKKVDTKNI